MDTIAYRRKAAAIVSSSASGAAKLNTVPTIFLIHDDLPTRRALESLVSGRGWNMQTYGSADAFLRQRRVLVPGCLVLDLNLPDRSGLDVQQHLLDRRELPLVFICGCGDVPAAVRAMKAGAVEFLMEPHSDEEVSSAVEHAIERSRTVLRQAAEISGLLLRYTKLSPREREVMELVISGRLNKQVASELGISEVTVKAHRGRMMQKMKAGSLAELVRMSLALCSGAAWLASAEEGSGSLSGHVVDVARSGWAALQDVRRRLAGELNAPEWQQVRVA